MSGHRLSGYRAVSCKLRAGHARPLRAYQSIIGPQFFISSAAQRTPSTAAVMMPPA